MTPTTRSKWNLTKTIITMMASAIAGLFSWDLQLQNQLNEEQKRHNDFVKEIYQQQKIQSDSMEAKLFRLQNSLK